MGSVFCSYVHRCVHLYIVSNPIYAHVYVYKYVYICLYICSWPYALSRALILTRCLDVADACARTLSLSLSRERRRERQREKERERERESVCVGEFVCM